MNGGRLNRPARRLSASVGLIRYYASSELKLVRTDLAQLAKMMTPTTGMMMPAIGSVLAANAAYCIVNGYRINAPTVSIVRAKNSPMVLTRMSANISISNCRRCAMVAAEYG